MYHFVTKMCTRVHISVTMWCLSGYGTGAFWDLWEWSNMHNFEWMKPCQTMKTAYTDLVYRYHRISNQVRGRPNIFPIPDLRWSINLINCSKFWDIYLYTRYKCMILWFYSHFCCSNLVQTVGQILNLQYPWHKYRGANAVIIWPTGVVPRPSAGRVITTKLSTFSSNWLETATVLKKSVITIHYLRP